MEKIFVEVAEPTGKSAWSLYWPTKKYHGSLKILKDLLTTCIYVFNYFFVFIKFTLFLTNFFYRWISFYYFYIQTFFITFISCLHFTEWLCFIVHYICKDVAFQTTQLLLNPAARPAVFSRSSHGAVGRVCEHAASNTPGRAPHFAVVCPSVGSNTSRQD